MVPATVTGVQLAAETGDGRPGFAPRDAPLAMLQATVRFAMWQYSRQRGPSAATLPGPVVADAAVQARYWSAPRQAASVDVGAADWANYQILYQGWPLPYTDPSTAVFYLNLALAAAATGAASLQSGLATAEQTLHAQVATLRSRG